MHDQPELGAGCPGDDVFLADGARCFAMLSYAVIKAGKGCAILEFFKLPMLLRRVKRLPLL